MDGTWARSQHVEDGRRVDDRGPEQLVRHRQLGPLPCRVVQGEPCPLEQDVSSQCVPIGAEARRGQADQRVSYLDALGAELGAALEDPHRESGNVEFVDPHHATVLCGLAAEQRAPRLAAPVRDAGHDLFDARGLHRSDSDIVEHEQRLGSDADEVVDAHGDEVDPDRVVAAGLAGHLELGADAVGRRDKHRIGVALGVESEHAAEPADAAEDARSRRRSDHALDPLDRLVARRDIDAGRGVSGTLLGHQIRPPAAPAAVRPGCLGPRPLAPRCRARSPV